MTCPRPFRLINPNARPLIYGPFRPITRLRNLPDGIGRLYYASHQLRGRRALVLRPTGATPARLRRLPWTVIVTSNPDAPAVSLEVVRGPAGAADAVAMGELVAMLTDALDALRAVQDRPEVARHLRAPPVRVSWLRVLRDALIAAARRWVAKRCARAI